MNNDMNEEVQKNLQQNINTQIHEEKQQEINKNNDLLNQQNINIQQKSQKNLIVREENIGASKDLLDMKEQVNGPNVFEQQDTFIKDSITQLNKRTNVSRTFPVYSFDNEAEVEKVRHSKSMDKMRKFVRRQEKYGLNVMMSLEDIGDWLNAQLWVNGGSDEFRSVVSKYNHWLAIKDVEGGDTVEAWTLLSHSINTYINSKKGRRWSTMGNQRKQVLDEILGKHEAEEARKKYEEETKRRQEEKNGNDKQESALNKNKTTTAGEGNNQDNSGTLNKKKEENKDTAGSINKDNEKLTMQNGSAPGGSNDGTTGTAVVNKTEVKAPRLTGKVPVLTNPLITKMNENIEGADIDIQAEVSRRLETFEPNIILNSKERSADLDEKQKSELARKVREFRFDTQQGLRKKQEEYNAARDEFLKSLLPAQKESLQKSWEGEGKKLSASEKINMMEKLDSEKKETIKNSMTFLADKENALAQRLFNNRTYINRFSAIGPEGLNEKEQEELKQLKDTISLRYLDELSQTLKNFREVFGSSEQSEEFKALFEYMDAYKGDVEALFNYVQKWLSGGVEEVKEEKKNEKENDKKDVKEEKENKADNEQNQNIENKIENETKDNEEKNKKKNEEDITNKEKNELKDDNKNNEDSNQNGQEHEKVNKKTEKNGEGGDNKDDNNTEENQIKENGEQKLNNSQDEEEKEKEKIEEKKEEKKEENNKGSLADEFEDLEQDEYVKNLKREREEQEAEKIRQEKERIEREHAEEDKRIEKLNKILKEEAERIRQEDLKKKEEAEQIRQKELEEQEKEYEESKKQMEALFDELETEGKYINFNEEAVQEKTVDIKALEQKINNTVQASLISELYQKLKNRKEQGTRLTKSQSEFIKVHDTAKDKNSDKDKRSKAQGRRDYLLRSLIKDMKGEFLSDEKFMGRIKDKLVAHLQELPKIEDTLLGTREEDVCKAVKTQNNGIKIDVPIGINKFEEDIDDEKLSLSLLLRAKGTYLNRSGMQQIYDENIYKLMKTADTEESKKEQSEVISEFIDNILQRKKVIRTEVLSREQIVKTVGNIAGDTRNLGLRFYDFKKDAALKNRKDKITKIKSLIQNSISGGSPLSLLYTKPDSYLGSEEFKQMAKETSEAGKQIKEVMNMFVTGKKAKKESGADDDNKISNIVQTKGRNEYITITGIDDNKVYYKCAGSMNMQNNAMLEAAEEVDEERSIRVEDFMDILEKENAKAEFRWLSEVPNYEKKSKYKPSQDEKDYADSFKSDNVMSQLWNKKETNNLNNLRDIKYWLNTQAWVNGASTSFGAVVTAFNNYVNGRIMGVSSPDEGEKLVEALRTAAEKYTNSRSSNAAKLYGRQRHNVVSGILEGLESYGAMPVLKGKYTDRVKKNNRNDNSEVNTGNDSDNVILDNLDQNKADLYKNLKESNLKRDEDSGNNETGTDNEQLEKNQQIELLKENKQDDNQNDKNNNEYNVEMKNKKAKKEENKDNNHEENQENVNISSQFRENVNNENKLNSNTAAPDNTVQIAGKTYKNDLGDTGEESIIEASKELRSQKDKLDRKIAQKVQELNSQKENTPEYKEHQRILTKYREFKDDMEEKKIANTEENQKKLEYLRNQYYEADEKYQIFEKQWIEKNKKLSVEGMTKETDNIRNGMKELLDNARNIQAPTEAEVIKNTTYDPQKVVPLQQKGENYSIDVSINMKEHQIGMECWAVSLATLFRTRGINLDKDALQRHRNLYYSNDEEHNMPYYAGKLQYLEERNSGQVHNIQEEADFVNYILKEKIPDTKLKLQGWRQKNNTDLTKQELKDNIVEGLSSGSPVSLLYTGISGSGMNAKTFAGHYVTITGIEGETLKFKHALDKAFNGVGDNGGDYDAPQSITLDQLVSFANKQGSRYNIELHWIGESKTQENKNA